MNGERHILFHQKILATHNGQYGRPIFDSSSIIMNRKLGFLQLRNAKKNCIRSVLILVQCSFDSYKSAIIQSKAFIAVFYSSALIHKMGYVAYGKKVLLF